MFFLISTMCMLQAHTCYKHTVSLNTISFTFQGSLHDQKHELEKKRSSRAARVFLWITRIAINVFILILLGATAAAIYYAQKFSSDVSIFKRPFSLRECRHHTLYPKLILADKITKNDNFILLLFVSEDKCLWELYMIIRHCLFTRFVIKY